MRTLLRRILKVVGIGLISPVVFSIILSLPWRYASVVGWCLGTIWSLVCIFMVGMEPDEVEYWYFGTKAGYGWMAWGLIGICVAAGTNYSVPRTTLLIAAIVYGALLLDEGERRFRNWRQERKWREEERRNPSRHSVFGPYNKAF